MSAQYKSEYSQPMVGAACGYNTLGCYLGSNNAMPTMRPGSTTVVPTYGGPIGYNSLTNGKTPGCMPYFNMASAYGSGAGSCNTSYTTRLCGGGCPGK